MARLVGFDPNSTNVKFQAVHDKQLAKCGSNHEVVFVVRKGTLVVFTRKSPLPGQERGEDFFISTSLSDGLDAALDNLLR